MILTGQQLYDKYQQEGQKAGPDSDAWEYAQLLGTALATVGDALYPALEEAEKFGKRIDVTHPISFNEGPSEPNGIEII